MRPCPDAPACGFPPHGWSIRTVRSPLPYPADPSVNIPHRSTGRRSSAGWRRRGDAHLRMCKAHSARATCASLSPPSCLALRLDQWPQARLHLSLDRLQFLWGWAPCSQGCAVRVPGRLGTGRATGPALACCQPGWQTRFIETPLPACQVISTLLSLSLSLHFFFLCK